MRAKLYTTKRKMHAKHCIVYMSEQCPTVSKGTGSLNHLPQTSGALLFSSLLSDRIEAQNMHYGRKIGSGIQLSLGRGRNCLNVCFLCVCSPSCSRQIGWGTEMSFGRENFPPFPWSSVTRRSAVCQLWQANAVRGDSVSCGLGHVLLAYFGRRMGEITRKPANFERNLFFCYNSLPKHDCIAEDESLQRRQ